MKELILGNNIAKIRKELDMTQQELADKLGLYRTSLSTIENGKNGLTIYTMIKISNALNRPLGDIFFNPSVLNVETEETA